MTLQEIITALKTLTREERMELAYAAWGSYMEGGGLPPYDEAEAARLSKLGPGASEAEREPNMTRESYEAHREALEAQSYIEWRDWQ